MPSITQNMHNKCISKESQCCNSVTIFNMIASCVYSSILPFMNKDCVPTACRTLPPVERVGITKTAPNDSGWTT